MTERGQTQDHESDSELDDTVLAAQPKTVVKAFCAVMGIAGLFVALNGAQFLGVHFIGGGFREYLPYPMIVLGLLQIFMATQTYRARSWTPLGAPALAALSLLAIVGWFVHVLTAGALSCYAFITPPLCLASLVLSLLSIGPVSRAAAARQRLADEGLNLGL